nr:MAG TPA: hypothetical protein [Caudoviricetes sp.]
MYQDSNYYGREKCNFLKSGKNSRIIFSHNSWISLHFS